MKRIAFRMLLGHALLIAVSLTMIAPFLWMVATSFKPLTEVESGRFLPREWQVRYEADPSRPVEYARVSNYAEVIRSRIGTPMNWNMTKPTISEATTGMTRMGITGRK